MNYVKEWDISVALESDDKRPCEHVQKDHTLAVWAGSEADSLGVDPEVLVFCQACKNEYDDEEHFEECVDCKKYPKNGEYQNFRYWDDPSDEHMVVCDECALLDEHRNRVKENRESAELDMALDDEDDNWFDPTDYPDDDELDETDPIMVSIEELDEEL